VKAPDPIAVLTCEAILKLDAPVARLPTTAYIVVTELFVAPMHKRCGYVALPVAMTASGDADEVPVAGIVTEVQLEPLLVLYWTTACEETELIDAVTVFDPTYPSAATLDNC
ncbi:hypothetical protein, partial [Staphylococcus aureus]